MENKNINTHNVTILSEFPLFGEAGNITFSLSEYNGDLGIIIDKNLQPILGRVVGQNHVYLFGFKTNDRDLGFVVYDSKNNKFYNAYYDYNTFVIDEKGCVFSNYHIFKANYDTSEDYNYNLPWFNSVKRKINSKKSITPQIFVFYECVRNSNGAILVNNLVNDFNDNDKDLMMAAIEGYIFKFGAYDTERAIYDLPLIKRMSFVRIVRKLFDRKLNSERRKKAFMNFAIKASKMSDEDVYKIYLMLEKDYEVDQVFKDFKTTLMHDVLEEKVFGKI